MWTIGKLRHPVPSEASNLFVLTDEAHRTQYGSLGANLRGALPNAVFFGFTGTPIDKRDRSTLATFGPYIDRYTIEQAVADGTTVPIFYESRMAELQIIGQTLDQVFDRVFADRTPEERAAIRKKYATEAAIAQAPRRIEAICLDLLDHYTRYIEPGGFKAQVVTPNRRAASADLARSRAHRVKVHVEELVNVGDEDAAAEQLLSYLTHLARAELIDAGVYPASRPELADQLRRLGRGQLAGRPMP